MVLNGHQMVWFFKNIVFVASMLAVGCKSADLANLPLQDTRPIKYAL